MTKTQNYQLNQWESTDKISRGDFNSDNAKLDAALVANAKALSDYKTANDAVVAKKAEQSAVTALQQSVSTELAALAANLGSSGHNARIAYGTYTGTGTFGKTNPTSLTFDFCPVVVIVTTTKYTSTGSIPTIMVRSSGRAFPETDTSTGLYLVLTWSDHGVSWYTTYSYASTREPCGQDQLNYNGTTYYYAAIGYDTGAAAE